MEASTEEERQATWGRIKIRNAEDPDGIPITVRETAKINPQHELERDQTKNARGLTDGVCRRKVIARCLVRGWY